MHHSVFPPRGRQRTQNAPARLLQKLPNPVPVQSTALPPWTAPGLALVPTLLQKSKGRGWSRRGKCAFIRKTSLLFILMQNLD
jgi:hypothetical protein